MPSPETRPPAGTPKDYEHWAEERAANAKNERRGRWDHDKFVDGRVSGFLQWFKVFTQIVVAGAAVGGATFLAHLSETQNTLLMQQQFQSVTIAEIKVGQATDRAETAKIKEQVDEIRVQQAKAAAIADYVHRAN